LKRTFIIVLFCSISLIQYGQIIANHFSVADFDKIPSYYIDEVKTMLIGVPGESHSAAYRTGMELLEAVNPAYSANVATGEPYTNQYLRVNLGTWTGEDVWYTWYAYPIGSRPAASTSIKNLIKEYSDQGHPFSAIGFAWCWDMTGGNVSSSIDPIYGNHWYGWSVGGPEGDRCWGLDATDFSITGNNVCMDTYLNATEDYSTFCKTNGYLTKVFFTTGPVDAATGEAGYQIHLKHEYIRNYIAANPNRILFDYADILCYDDNGTLATTTWNGNTYPTITSLNLGDGSLGHIGNVGAIRLAKAQWWLLARMAGWNGTSSNINVTGITVTGTAGASTITTDNGTLQLSAAVSPANATDQSVTWSIANGTGQATINATGLVTAINNGTVTARATANDGSSVFGSLVITIENQIGSITSTNNSGEKQEPLKIIVTRSEIKILLNDKYISWKADLYNLQGKLIRSKFVEGDIFVFDVSLLPSGFYIVMLSSAGNFKVAKVIKPL
jgi:hypothetical protein